MPPDTCLGSQQVDLGRLAEHRCDIESNLHIVDLFRHALEVQQCHGLLVQLVHCRTAMFRGRLKHRGPCAAHSAHILQPRHQQREHGSRRMGRDQRRGMKVRRGCRRVLNGIAYPGCGHQYTRLTFKHACNVDNAGVRLHRGAPVGTGLRGCTSEKYIIHTLERVGLNGLDHRRFIADGLDLAQPFCSVHQQQLGTAERAVLDSLCQLLAV